MGDDFVFFALPDSGHKEKTRIDAGAAEGHRFFRAGYAEPGCAFGFEGLGAGGSAVTVGVGFDNGADADVITDKLLYSAEVVAERVEGNLGPGGTVGYG